MKRLQCASPLALAEVSENQIRQAMDELDADNLDALVQDGAYLTGAIVCPEAEMLLGKPAIAINTFSAWSAVRSAGIDDRLAGRGRIFKEH